MLLNQILAEFLEELCIPLDDGFLLFSSLPLHLIVLFLEPVEDVLEFFLVRENLDHSAQESTIDVLDELLAVDIVDFLGVLQSEDCRYDIRELLLVHLAQKLIRALIQVLSLILAQVIEISNSVSTANITSCPAGNSASSINLQQVVRLRLNQSWVFGLLHDSLLLALDLLSNAVGEVVAS